MKNRLLLTFFILCFFLSKSQIGPNVVAGAGGVVLNKGGLDAELILDIIATKKGEIKSELGKRLVLSRIENGSFAFYNYAEKNLDILFNEANKEIIMKEIMRNSAELMLVYGIAETYLLNYRFKSSLSVPEKKFLQVVKDFGDSVKYKEFLSTIKFKKDLTKDNGNENLNIKRTLSGISDDMTNLNKIYALNFLSNSEGSYRESSFRLREKYTNYNISHVFVDMVYDVCRENKYILKTGLFQNNNYSDERYRALSKFYLLEKKDSADGGIFKTIRALQPEIKAIVDNLFKYYGILEEISNLDTINKATITSLKNMTEQTDIDRLKRMNIDSLVSDTAIRKTLKFLRQITSSDNCLRNSLLETVRQYRKMKGTEIIKDEKLAQIQAKLLQKIAIFTFVNSTTLENNLQDYLYTIEKEIIPDLTVLNNSSQNNFTGLLNSFISLRDCIHNSVLDDFSKDFNQYNFVINNSKLYLNLVKCFGNLNKVESYDYIFKFITNLAETYGSQQAKTVVRWITTSADKYSTINTEVNTLTIDVEAIAGDFYKKFGKSQQSKLNFLFTVGANINVSSEGKYSFLVGSENKSFNNHQFICEKIGLRYNIIDFNRKRQFGRYDLVTGYIKRDKRRAARIGKEPLIDNIHIQAFGSGLLYQIQSLNSQSDFTKPMYGFGTGLTFFNGLDLSINYMAPFDAKSIKNGFFNFAFDISFMEYLGELKKKKAKAN